MSLPVRGAWIEIYSQVMPDEELTESLPVRGAWIEIFQHKENYRGRKSLPVRGAWIEINKKRNDKKDAERRSL